MTILAALKIITRSWWRNKVFFFISVVSLAVGLACTNLLFTYFVHDYNIEHGNRKKDRIFCLRQDNPMQEGEKITYVSADIPPMLKEKYAEVEEYLRISSLTLQYSKYRGNLFPETGLICADTTLLHFFPYQTLAGSLEQTLKQPDKVALNESFARKVFGERNPLGEILEVKTAMDGTKNYEVAAVLKPRSQSLLQFDMLTGTGKEFFGGMTFLMLSSKTQPEQLAKKINQDKVPTLVPGRAQYYVDALPALYFVTPNSGQLLSYISQSNVQLLYISLAAALLILIIACCNYTNMSLSRVLQQLKMIHIEKLMGSRLKDIRIQLFGDAFLTVLLAFGFSLLIINDCLSLFNGILAAHLTIGFFFSLQMLPLLLLFVLIVSIVPAWYISRKLSSLSFSEYKMLYGGKKKQHFIAFLVILQFVISMGLIFATFTANEQIALIKAHARCYENVIEVGSFDGPPAAPLKDELEKQGQGISSIALSHGSVLNAWLRELPIRQADGTEIKSHLLMLFSDIHFIKTLGLQQLSGNSPRQLIDEYPYPVLINESFVKKLIPAGTNPVGRYMREFDAMADSIYIIGGIVKDFSTGSLESEVTPCMIQLSPDNKMFQARYLHIKLVPEKRQETLLQMERAWKKINGNSEFQYTDMHKNFMEQNNKVLSFFKILTAYSLIGLVLTCFGLFGISWYATRQRIREISIRKIHGASPWQIIRMLNKPFCLQMLIAYILAIPLVYWLMLHWREQFAYQAPLCIMDFLWPLLIVWTISTVTVCLQGYLLNKANPIDCIKSE